MAHGTEYTVIHGMPLTLELLRVQALAVKLFTFVAYVAVDAVGFGLDGCIRFVHWRARWLLAPLKAWIDRDVASFEYQVGVLRLRDVDVAEGSGIYRAFEAEAVAFYYCAVQVSVVVKAH